MTKITSELLLKEFYTASEKRTVAIEVVLCAVLFVLSYYAWNISFFLFLLDVIVMFFVVMATIVKVTYLRKTIRAIKNNEYVIMKDILVKMNEHLTPKDAKKLISFRFKAYNKLVYELRDKFEDVQIGDRFYIVSTETSEDPIAVYDVKRYEK